MNELAQKDHIKIVCGD